MFDLIGNIKKKSGLDDMFGDTMTVPQSVQEVLQIKTVYPDGIFWLGKDIYSKMFKFSDINYAVSSKADKEDDFFKYSEILNSLENGVSSQITIINRKIKNNELDKIIMSEQENDGKDKYRKEMNEMLMNVVERVIHASCENSSILKYIVLVCGQQKTLYKERNRWFVEPNY